jgi:hypothetical protein
MYILVKCKMWNLVLWFPWDHEDIYIVNVIHQIQKGPKMIYLMKILRLKSNALCKVLLIFGTFGHDSLGRWNPKRPFVIDIVKDLETLYFNDDNLFPIKILKKLRKGKLYYGTRIKLMVDGYSAPEKVEVFKSTKE